MIKKHVTYNDNVPVFLSAIDGILDRYSQSILTNGNSDMDSCTYWYDIYVCIFGGRYDAYEGQRSSRHFHGGFRQQNDVRERILETRLQHW